MADSSANAVAGTLESLKGKAGAVLSVAKIVGGFHYSNLPYRLINYVKGSSALGIRDVASGKWAIRFDRPHGPVSYNHINFNKAVTGVRDPHTYLPPGTNHVLKGVGKVADVVNTVVVPVAIAASVYQVGSAYMVDGERGDGKLTETTKATAAVGGAWAGAYAGGYAGGVLGAKVGGAIGSVFGGVGAVPCAVAGSLLASVGGAVAGGVYASHYAQAAVEPELVQRVGNAVGDGMNYMRSRL